jgi:S-adenosylmethionine decarboxylase
MNSTSSTLQLNEYQSQCTLHGFEGPEKKIEIEFRTCGELNLRCVNADTWQTRLLDYANCKIIAQRSNEFFDAYVLSESSLFVYPEKILLKTCGTTTLLHTIEPLITIAKELNMTIEFVMYSRKNFVFPEHQPSPHKNFNEEVEYLNKYFPHGSGYIIGPLSEDHWYLFTADYRDLTTRVSLRAPDQTFEVLMHDLDQDRMKQFYCTTNYENAEVTTQQSGISDILPGSSISAYQFDPCGYSMNGLLKQYYSTIHITPEPHCSFVSYESNYLPEKSFNGYRMLLERIIEVFQPGRFSVTLIADDHAPTPDNSELDNTEECYHLNPRLNTYSAFSNFKLSGFDLKSKSHYEFDRGYTLTFCSYKRSVSHRARSQA